MKSIESATGSGRRLDLDGGLDLTTVGIKTEMEFFYVDLPHADFLAAVESELDVRLVSKDAVVVERGDLPAVMVRDDGDVVCGDAVFDSSKSLSEHARRFAVQYLAIAEHLDSLVDEAEVKALADLIVEHEQETTPPTLVARRLLATGRVHVSGEAGA